MTSILKADTIQDAAGNNIINEAGDVITIGASGDTINIAGTVGTGFSANTPYFEAYISANQTLADATDTKLNFNTETFDSGGMYDTTNFRFLPTTAGKYLIYFQVTYNAGGVDKFHSCETQVRKNGSIHKKYYFDDYDNYMSYAKCTTGSTIIDFNGSSDYVEMYGNFNVTSSTGQVESGSYSTFGGYKLIT